MVRFVAAKASSSLTLVLPLLFALILSFAITPPILAQETKSLSFVDDRPLVYQLSELSGGLSVIIRNNGPSEIEVQVRLLDFFTEDGKHLPTEALVTELPEKKKIPAGQEEVFFFRFRDKPLLPLGDRLTLPPGKYSSIITAYSDTGESIQKNLTIFITDFFIWPFLTILLGVLVSFVLTKWLREKRPKDKLRLHIKELLVKIGRYELERRDKPINNSFSIYDSALQLCQDAEESIRRDDLEAAKKTLESTDDYFEDYKQFHERALQRLYDKLLQLEQYLKQQGENDELPVIRETTLRLLIGEKIIGLEDLKARKAKIEKQETFVEAFRNVYHRLLEGEWAAKNFEGFDWSNKQDDETAFKVAKDKLEISRVQR